MKIEKIKTETNKFELTIKRREVIAALQAYFNQKIPAVHDVKIRLDSWDGVKEFDYDHELIISWVATETHPTEITEEPKPITREDIENWPREMPG